MSNNGESFPWVVLRDFRFTHTDMWGGAARYGGQRQMPEGKENRLRNHDDNYVLSSESLIRHV